MKEQWDLAGRQIKDIVQSAIEENDFSRLSQNIGNVINDTIDATKSDIAEHISQNRSGTQGRTYTNTKQGSSGRKYTNTVQMQKPDPGIYTSRVPGRISGMVELVLGIIICITFLIIMCVLLPVYFWIGGTGLAVAAVIMGILAVVGAVIAVLGGRNMGHARLFDRIRRYMGTREFCKITDLADAMGKEPKKLLRALHRMIDKRMFLQGHVDGAGTYLMVTDQVYDQYKQSEAQYKQREYDKLQSEKARMEEEKKYKADEATRRVIEEGQRYIEHIHLCNDKLPGEEISDKLYRLEEVVKRIFAEVKRRPELAGDLNKMMNYYLPTTSKLLDVYCQLDIQPIQGENIIKSKKEIEDSLDTINSAFERLLDSFFADTAMDVSSDISVLHTMLAQEGLTGSAFEKK